MPPTAAATVVDACALTSGSVWLSEYADADVVRLERVLAPASRSVRWLERAAARRHRCPPRSARTVGVSVGSMRVFQKSGVAGSKISARRPILGLLDRRLGDDHRLFVARHFRLRLDDVDRRHGADLRRASRCRRATLRQVQRLLLHAQVVDRVRPDPSRRCARCAWSARSSAAAATSEISRFLRRDQQLLAVWSILKLRSSGCVVAAR